MNTGIWNAKSRETAYFQGKKRTSKSYPDDLKRWNAVINKPLQYISGYQPAGWEESFIFSLFCTILRGILWGADLSLNIQYNPKRK